MDAAAGPSTILAAEAEPSTSTSPSGTMGPPPTRSMGPPPARTAKVGSDVSNSHALSRSKDSSHDIFLQAPNGPQQQTRAQQHVGQQQRKAFIKGIPPAAGKAELEALLAPCGTVVDLTMPEDRSSQPPRHRVSLSWLQCVCQQAGICAA